MGWTGRYDDRPAWQVVTEEIEGDGTYYKVVARSGRYYAVKRLSDGEVFAVVALVTRDKNGYILTKLVDESMGPNERLAPEKIMKLLSPLAPEDADPEGDMNWAAQWRRDCWANIEAKKLQPKLKEGDVIKLARPITFTNGATADTLRYQKGFRFKTVPGGLYVRLGREWKRDYKWEVMVDG